MIRQVGVVSLTLFLSACMPEPAGGPCDYEMVKARCTVKQVGKETISCSLSDKTPSMSGVFERLNEYTIYDATVDVAINDTLDLTFSAITSGTCNPLMLTDISVINETN